MGVFYNAISVVSQRIRNLAARSGKYSGHLATAMRTILATLLALLLSTVLAEPFSVSTSALFSSPEKKDFQMPDLFAQIADHRPVRTLEDRIILVNIGRAGREEIAEGLSLLSLCGPRAIGIDINFADTTGFDVPLLEAISCNPGIVFPLGLSSDDNGRFFISDVPFFYGLDGLDVNYGVTNLPSKTEKATIREYAVDFDTDKGNVPSFVTRLASLAYPESVGKLKAHGEKLGVTSYHSREFNVVELPDIERQAELFADKIVMIGTLDDASDMHATPVNSYMPGLMLHAHALATVLDGTWFHKTSRTFDYLAAILICLVITGMAFAIKSRFRGVILRVTQVVLAYLAVRLGYSAFIDHNLLFDFTHTLLIIAFGLFAVDIWNGLEETGHRLLARAERKHKRKQSLSCEKLY